VAVALGVAAAVPGARAQTPPVAGRIAQDGFGDARNSYAWSMAWFKGRLYVGTARSALCVEGATIDYFVPGAGAYRPNPMRGVRCPPSINDADLRAEIWRYDPATGRWARVFRSPRVRNPRAKGRRIARDIGYRGMVVMDGALYVGAMTPNEFIPELGRRQPPRILRSTNGRRFRALKGPRIIHTPIGARRPVGIRSMTVLDGRMYVTAAGGLTGDGAVVEVRRPSARKPRYRQVSPSRLSVFELEVFDGALYAGTGDADAGYGVWRAADRPRDWRPVLTGGAGRGDVITSVVSMASYRGHLYVGASGWGVGLVPASELVRIAPDGTWDVVAGTARTGPDGVERQPLSGLPDGFGNPFNSHFWRMQVYDGALLLGTNDWSSTLSGSAQLEALLAPGYGFDLFSTCDGTSWSTVTSNGFGHPEDFGLRTFAASPDGLFIGSTDHVKGAAVYRLRGPLCGAPAAPAPPASAAAKNRRGAARLVRGCAPRPPEAFPSSAGVCTRMDERKP